MLHSSPALEKEKQNNSWPNHLEKQMDTGTKIMTTKGLKFAYNYTQAKTLLITLFNKNTGSLT